MSEIILRPYQQKFIDANGKPVKKKFCPLCGQELPKSIIKAGYHAPDTTEHDDTLTEIMDSVTVRTARTPEQFMYLARKFNRPRGWAAAKAKRFAKTYDDLVHIADVVGYKRGWAWYMWQEKNSAQTC